MILPNPKSGERFIAHYLDGGDVALGMKLFELAIDKGVIEANFSGVLCSVGEINSREAGPIDCTKAHGTWFARGVKLAILEFEDAKFSASLANGHDFCMSRRIIGGGHLIEALGKDCVVLYNDRTEGTTTPGLNAIDRQLNRTCHETVAHVLKPRSWRHPNSEKAEFVPGKGASISPEDCFASTFFGAELSILAA